MPTVPAKSRKAPPASMPQFMVPSVQGMPPKLPKPGVPQMITVTVKRAIKKPAKS